MKKKDDGLLVTGNDSSGLFKFPEEQYSIAYDNVDPTQATTCTIISALDQLVLTQENPAPDGTQYVASNLNLVVYADTVIVRGPLSCPGKNVSLYARVVGSTSDAQGNAAQIDVSGVAGALPPPDEPKQPQAASGPDGNNGDAGPGAGGSPGNSGATGNPGLSAGEIALYTESFQSGTNIAFVANGGAGAVAQDGQAGQDGGDGGNGHRSGRFSGYSGGAGGSGGDGGRGGDGGDGGNGGSVTIAASVETSGVSLTASAQGGNGGNGGNGGVGGIGGDPGESYFGSGGDPPAGNGGNGGDGGNSGNDGNGGTVSTTLFLAINANVGAGSSGGNPGTAGQGGAPGNPGDNPAGSPGNSGNNGGNGGSGTAGTTSSVTIAYNDLAPRAVPAQRSMTLQKAKLLYLTADPDANPAAYTTAATLLAWLQNVTQFFTTSPPPAPAGFTADDVAVMASIYSQAAGVAFQMTLKRDFFGNLPSYVPQGSYTFYQGLLAGSGNAPGMLGANGTFTAIESNYLTYFNALQQQNASLGQLEAAQSQGTTQGQALTTQYQDALTSANSLVTTINADQTAVENQYRVMVQAISDLEFQIGGLAGAGCTFDSVVKGLGMIAQISGDPDAKQAQTIASNVNTALQTGIAGAEGISSLPTTDFVKQADVLGQNVATVNDGYNVGQGIITEDDPNAYKLVAAATDFEKILQPYLGLTSAQEAIDAINQYVTLVQQRNADILKFNSYVGQLASLQAQINQNTAQLDQVQTAINAGSDPALAPLVAFMARLYHDARAQVIYTLYMAGRSYAFWSLDAKYSAFTTFIGLTDPSGINAGTLASAQQQIMTDLEAAIEKFGTGPQNFPAPGTKQLPQGITFVLTKADNPGLFDTFTTLNSAGLYQVSFAIPAVFASTPESENPFFSQANVRLTTVRPWIHGAATQNGVLTVEITHTGGETIVDPTNNANSFTHEPITKNFAFHYAQIYQPSAITEDGDFDAAGDDSDYAQPGPFTTWTIQIDPNYNTGLDMTGVDSISVEFWGNSYAFRDGIAFGARQSRSGQ